MISSGESEGRWIGPVDRVIKALVLSAFVSQKLASFTVKPNKEDLQLLKQLIEDRQAHAGHRQDLPTCRGSRGHPVSGRRTRPRKSRHHRVRRDISWGEPHKVPKIIH